MTACPSAIVIGFESWENWQFQLSNDTIVIESKLSFAQANQQRAMIYVDLCLRRRFRGCQLICFKEADWV